MSNLHLVAELMDLWVREENYALTARLSELTLKYQRMQVARQLLADDNFHLRQELEDAQHIINTHVDLNFQLQERIQYLESFVMRLRDFPVPPRRVRRRLSQDFLSSTSENSEEDEE